MIVVQERETAARQLMLDLQNKLPKVNQDEPFLTMATTCETCGHTRYISIPRRA